jgi:hypothetical protein
VIKMYHFEIRNVVQSAYFVMAVMCKPYNSYVHIM